MDVIKEKRNLSQNDRAAARRAAIEKGKESKKDAESKKKAEKAKLAAASGRGQTKVSKQGAKGAPVKVQARTR